MAITKNIHILLTLLLFEYKRNKYLSVEYTKLMILEEDQEFIDLFKDSKKKDDLADAYLQGIYFIEK